MLGFPFFAIGASSIREGREEKRDWKKKGDKEQNNTIRMLLDFFFFLLKYAHCRGEERVQFHRIPHEISRGSTRF